MSLFWQGMVKAIDLGLLDKIMVGMNSDGSTKYADINQLGNLMTALGSASFRGNASPSSNPGVQTEPSFWLATTAGTYTNYGGVILPVNSIGFISWDGSSFSIISLFVKGDKGDKGDIGNKGWALVLANVNDGSRVVQRLIDYVGGEGVKPTANINSYLTSTGYTTNISLATDIRGPQGMAGTANIINWTATAFASGSQVKYLGKLWEANAAVLSTDVPGTSAKWVDMGSGYALSSNVYTVLQLSELPYTGGDGFYVNKTTGALVANSAFRTTEIVKLNGSTFKSISLINSAPAASISFWDADGLYISGIGNAGTTTITISDLKSVIPDGASGVRFSFEPAKANTVTVTKYFDAFGVSDIPATVKTLNGLPRIGYSKQLADFSYTGGYMSPATGLIVPSALWRITDPIPILSFLSMTNLSIYTNSSATPISLFDIDMKLISFLPNPPLATGVYITEDITAFPSNVKFVRISYDSTKINKATIKGFSDIFGSSKLTTDVSTLVEKERKAFILPKRTSLGRRCAIISIILDDNLPSASYQWIIDAFEARGMFVTVALTLASSNEATFNLPYYKAMQDRGHGMLSHDKSHRDYGVSSRTEAEIRSYTVETLSWLDAAGISRRGFVYPGNSRSALSDTILSEYYDFSFAGQTKTTHLIKKESMQSLSRFGAIENYTFAQIKAAIDEAVSTKGLLVLWGHAINFKAGFTISSQQDFINILDYIKTLMDSYSLLQMNTTDAMDYYYSVGRYEINSLLP